MRAWILSALMLAGLPGIAPAEPMLLAAASTSRAMEAALAESGLSAITSYGASGILARQIEHGAPADLFVSANPKWMDYLQDLGLVAPESVSVLMSNRLVLIGPKGAPALSADEVPARLKGELFVMADPATAPVGAYGQAALESLGLWDAASAALVPMRNTLGTVAAVTSGEAALGLVYASDAMGQNVDVLLELPAESHPPVRYLVAPVASGEQADSADALLQFLLSDAGRTVLESHGFLAAPAGS